MGLFLQNGTRVTKTSVAKTADPDPLVKIDTDLFQRRSYGANDAKADGSILTLFCKAGKVLRQSELDALFPLATVTGVSPASGVAGAVVTLLGTELDGVSSVKFDNVEVTAKTIVSSREVRVTVPAGTAGPADILVTDDGGNVTKAAAFTYTA